jgi:hypothetical protein
MYFKRSLLIVVLILFSSCDFFKTKTSIKTVIEPIDFHSVDAYPLLPECEQLSSRDLQRDCFYTQISNRIKTSLDTYKFKFSENRNETILVTINVNEKGKLVVKSITSSKEIKIDIPKLDSIITQSFTQIFRIQPAIKSGIPVTSEYVLPIVIKTE